jgi:hypothetical protein
MKRFKLLRFIQRHEVCPAWYTVAWHDWNSCGFYALPIPLALPFALARWVWAGLRTGSKELAADTRVAYLDGIQQGIRMARKDRSLLYRPFAASADNKCRMINANAYDQRGGKQ